MTRPIIILGAERSGTSVLTEMVVRWGAFPGEPELLKGPDAQNPRGYWEYLPLWNLLAEIGDFAAGVSWWDASFEDHIRNKLRGDARIRANALVRRMVSPGRPWVWKDPALSFFLPFWREIWGDAAYVIAVRDPWAVAMSWQRFAAPGLPASRSLIGPNLLRWQYMTMLVLEQTGEARERLFVQYEDVIRSPAAAAVRLADFLSQACGQAQPSDRVIQGMSEVVDPGLWHNRGFPDPAGAAGMSEAQRELYGALRALASGCLAAYEPARFPLPAAWREVVREGEALARSYREANR